MKTPHIPVPIIAHNAGLIIAAGQADAAVSGRLDPTLLPAAAALCKKLTDDIVAQKGAKGGLGQLTQAQILALDVLHHCVAQAQKTAKLAFPGDSVIQHETFQTGPHQHNDLGSYLSRVDIVLGGVLANLAALKKQGWSDKETTAFQTARAAFGPAEQYRETSIGGAKDKTTAKNADATQLYANLLTIQNAADLEYPAANPANAGTRATFRLGIFPPDHGGNHAPAPAPTPATPKP
jgi:hypothetical protein